MNSSTYVEIDYNHMKKNTLFEKILSFFEQL